MTILNKAKSFFNAHWPIVAVIALFVIIRIITLQHHAVAEWDAAVYVGMGKYMFSHGTIGTWEALRPLALPFVLGLAWKAGLDPYAFGIGSALLASVGTLVVAYLFAEEVRKDSGTIAAVVLGASSVFFSYSSIPVTDIVSAFFALLSLFLVYKAVANKQYFFSGLFAAIAFMFRFPHGLLLVVGILVIFFKLFYSPSSPRLRRGSWNDRIATTIERLFAFGGGFAVLAVPFLVLNYYMYGNAFAPFLEATAGIQSYPSLYAKGLLFYPWQLLKQDPLFILFLLPIALLWKKNYRNASVTTLTIAVLIVGGYFFYQQHREVRFMLAFLPYIAILSAVGIAYLLEWFNMPQLLFFGLFGIVGFMVLAQNIAALGQNPNDPTWYAFNTYLHDAPKAHVLSSTPYLFAYTDVLLTHNLYADWNDAYKNYNLFRNDNDYIALDSCSLELGCADDNHCMDDKQALLTELNTQDTKVFSETTPSQCVLSIYRINHQ
jgi:4-amino-4-deoxy-L-arabinose transferase-like glycosyltransferase